MEAQIHMDGSLEIWSKDTTEAYALRKWAEDCGCNPKRFEKTGSVLIGTEKVASVRIELQARESKPIEQ